MNSHVKFFAGLLFPVFVMVALVRIAMNDMVVWKSIWAIDTLLWTLGIAVIGTYLETRMKPTPNKQVGQK